MEIPVTTRKEQFILEVTLLTNSPQYIHVIFKDARQPRTEYTNQVINVNGQRTIRIQCPLTGMQSTLVVYNEATGKSDGTFRVLNVERKPLEKRVDLIDINNRDLKSYLNFCQRFCFNAGVLVAQNYRSDDGKYMIEYLQTIVSQDTGNFLKKI